MGTSRRTIIGLVMIVGLALSSCQPEIVEVEKEVIVEKIVEVEKVVEKEVVKVRNPHTLIIAVADDTGSEFDQILGEDQRQRMSLARTSTRNGSNMIVLTLVKDI